MHLQHTNDIQMHKHTQTNYGQEKLLCINLKMPVQCVYKNWTAQSLTSLFPLTVFNYPLLSTNLQPPHLGVQNLYLSQRVLRVPPHYLSTREPNLTSILVQSHSRAGVETPPSLVIVQACFKRFFGVEFRGALRHNCQR
jgi:hypothetical protein